MEGLTLLLLLVVVPGDVWSWDAVPTAQGYLMCWANDPSYWTLIHCLNVGAVLTYDDAGLDQMWNMGHGGTTVFIQIVAYNDAGIGAASQPLQPAPYIPLVCP